MRRMTDAATDEPRSLRAELAALAVSEEGDRAAGYNAALRDVLEIIDRHESARQKSVHRAITRRKSEGKKIGGDVPYGYALAADGEMLCESTSEQRVIVAARKLREAGHSLREVARRLEARGLFPREGRKFHAAQIKRMTDEEK